MVKRLLARELFPPGQRFHLSCQRLTETNVEHDHDFAELCLILFGETGYRVNGREGELAPGFLQFIRPSDRHLYSPPEEGVELLNIAFPFPLCLQLLELILPGGRGQRLLEAPVPPTAVLSSAETHKIRERAVKIGERMVVAPLECDSLLLFLAMEIILQVLPGDAGEREKKPAPEWLTRVVERMQGRAECAEGLPRMVELACCSQEHLTREFRRYFGVTPTQFINRQRLNHAAHDLRKNRSDIQQIALTCGFDNLSHFYHRFREQFGQPPARYRRTVPPSVF